jgi:hypothetical protein
MPTTSKKIRIKKKLVERYKKELCPPIEKNFKIKLVERYEKKLCQAQR